MWLAAQLGWQMSMNPFVLATTLIFISIMSSARHTRAQLIISGLLYMVTVWVVNFFVLSGGYDHLLFQDYMNPILVWWYAVLGLVFAIVGVVHLGDWWRFQRHRDPTVFVIRSPRQLHYEEHIKRLRHTLWLALLVVMTAWAVSLMEARLTQNYYLFILLQRQIGEEGHLHKAVGTFLVYMASYTWPLIVFWLYCLTDSLSWRVRSTLNRFVSLEKVLMAGLYVSVSITLAYYLLKIIRL